MSIHVTEAHKKQFGTNVEMLAQQRGSMLAGCVRLETIQGEERAFDRIGQTEAKERTDRHADTPLMNTPHDRRWVSHVPYDWADLIDKPDIVNIITDPSSAYAVNAAWALGRTKDRAIIAAATGTARAGQKAEKTVAFPAATHRLAVNYVESGAAADSGLTVGKLRAALEILDGGDIDDMEEKFVAFTSRQRQDLLRTTEVTNADYNTVKALVNGQINQFLGFTFKRVSKGLMPKTGTTRSVLAWARSGIVLATAQDITTRVDERPDKNYSTQVYASQDLGAVRMEETHVVEILCQES